MDKKTISKQAFLASWDKIEEKNHPLDAFRDLFYLLKANGYDQKLFAFTSHYDLVLTASSEEFWAQTDQIRFLFTEIWRKQNGKSALEQLMHNTVGNLEELTKLQTIYDATHRDLSRKKDRVEVLLALQNLPEGLENTYPRVHYPLYKLPVLKIETPTSQMEGILKSVLDQLVLGGIA
ncbi:MAG: hypothetical protein AAFU64_16655 [Bacteroidota bacterium]